MASSLGRSWRELSFFPVRTLLALNIIACNALHPRILANYKHFWGWKNNRFNFEASRYSSRLFSSKSARSRDGVGKPKGYFDIKSRYVMERHQKSGLPNITKPFTVLGIESSCDDTGVAIVRSDGIILSNVVYSQYAIHERFGGIVPSLAMEAHKVNIEKAVSEALEKAGLSSVNEVDAIAVTRGPGLEICLRVGYRKAQELARSFQKPFVSVHHLEAHCMVARLAGVEVKAGASASPSSATKDISDEANISEPSLPHMTAKIEYPFLALLASGGHTSILLCKGAGDYTVLGGTLDDALGEAFDKAARQLGLRSSSSGGVAVEMAASRAPPNSTSSLNIKIPMRDKANCDFSYAGLKNAFRIAVQESRSKLGLDADCTNAPASQMEAAPELVILPDEVTAELCANFQHVAFSHVEDRIKRALNVVDRLQIPISALVVVGGVAANKELRKRLLQLLDVREAAKLADEERKPSPQSSETSATRRVRLVFPPPALCTDNGVMVAWTGIEKLLMGISDDVEEENVIPRWPLGAPLDDPALFKKEYTGILTSDKPAAPEMLISDDLETGSGACVA